MSESGKVHGETSKKPLDCINYEHNYIHVWFKVMLGHTKQTVSLYQTPQATVYNKSDLKKENSLSAS